MTVSDCIFCKIVSGTAPCSLVYEDERFMSFMDIYPWRPGHVLVIPKAHSARIGEQAPGVGRDLFDLGLRIAAAIRSSELPCDDLHFVLNDGAGANQSVAHVHLHVLPRHGHDLWKLGAELLKRPLVPLLRPTSQAKLDRQAAAISSALEALGPGEPR